MLAQQFRRGDTIVEVMFAIAVFSLVAVGTISIMNVGTTNSLRAVETTAARQAIDSEVAALQLMHDSYVAQYQTASTTYTGAAKDWYGAVTSGAVVITGAPTTVVGARGDTCPAPPSKAFVIDPKMNNTSGANYYTDASNIQGAGVGGSRPYPQFVYNPTSGAFAYATGLWVQAQSHPAAGNVAGYIDFYVNTCWPSPGGDGLMTLGTIVRLYVPA